MKTIATTTTMKTTLFVFLILFFAAPVFATSYEETMAANLQKLATTKTLTEFSTLANEFERIANAEPAKWHPRYYTAYCYVSAVTMNKMEADDIHKQLDIAQKHLDLLKKSFKNETEILILQAFIYQMRITDMGKGMKYSGMAGDMLDEAEKLSPNNPRVYYLRGNNVFHTPKAFGGGKEKAKPMFEKAATLFESVKPATAIDPTWGKEHNKQMIAQCNEDQ